jgi:hypothetical protein
VLLPREGGSKPTAGCRAREALANGPECVGALALQARGPLLLLALGGTRRTAAAATLLQVCSSNWYLPAVVRDRSTLDADADRPEQPAEK